MPHATTDDGIRLYYEEIGTGTPLIFVHEFAGDTRSWEPQVRHFARRYRCITFNARGYPPSDVPQTPSQYSQARAADDVRAVLDHLQLARAHVVGLSMGGFATLHFGFRHADHALEQSRATERRSGLRRARVLSFLRAKGWRRSRSAMRTGPRAHSFRTRTLVGLRSSSAISWSMMPWARPTPSWAFSASAPHSMI